jgi:hypothetical protein
MDAGAIDPVTSAWNPAAIRGHFSGLPPLCTVGAAEFAPPASGSIALFSAAIELAVFSSPLPVVAAGDVVHAVSGLSPEAAVDWAAAALTLNRPARIACRDARHGNLQSLKWLAASKRPAATMVPERPSRHCDRQAVRPYVAAMASDQIGAKFASLNRSSNGDFMTIDLTRRTLLHLAGASSLAAAAIAAAQAEGSGGRRADLCQPDADADRHGDAAGARSRSWSPIIIATRSA